MSEKRRYRKGFLESECGVSEAIGFLIIFSLVMIGIGLVTLYGYPILLQQQSTANVRNMERDMIVLQQDIKSLAFKNVPYKETTLQVAGGSLVVYSNATPGVPVPVLSITVTNNSGNSETYEYKCGQLRYESDALNDVIVLENGAVMTRQKQSEGSAMLSEPRWFIDTDSSGSKTLIINIITLSSDKPMSRSGVGTVKMRLAKSEPEIIPFDGPYKVTIDYTHVGSSDYNFTRAWENFFSSPNLGMDPDNEYKDVIIKEYEIEIQSL